MNNWIGMIKDVHSVITVVFSDGSICDMDGMSAEDFEDFMDDRPEVELQI